MKNDITQIWLLLLFVIYITHFIHYIPSIMYMVRYVSDNGIIMDLSPCLLHSMYVEYLTNIYV